MDRWDSSLFDWLSWRNGSITDVWGVLHRYQSLCRHRDLLRKHAIAWCPADMIPCRPKPGWVAVMFRVEEREFWTHLTAKEFDAIFKEQLP